MNAPRYERSSSTVHREVDGEVLIVPALEEVLDLDDVFFLLADPVAVRCWQLLATARTLEELAEVITAEFDVAPALARSDLQRFLDELLRAGAIARA